MTRKQGPMILRALTPFSAGDVGWVTEHGVIRQTADRPSPPQAKRVRALEGIRPHDYGPFEECE